MKRRLTIGLTLAVLLAAPMAQATDSGSYLAARTALIGWNGRAARAFDASVTSRAERVDQLHRQLGALQAELEAAVDEARRDQVRVVRLLDQARADC